MLNEMHHFDEWLNRSTWYTNHDLDLMAFYEALNKVIKANPDRSLPQREVRDYILERKSSTLADSTLIPVAEIFSRKAEDVSEFLLFTRK